MTRTALHFQATRPGRIRIGILSDPRNDAFADGYYTLLKQSAFSGNPVLRASMPQDGTERIAAALMQCDVALAQFGIPGVGNYQQSVNGFLNGYAASPKPPTGLITHDGANTRYAIDQWLSATGHELPGGALTIVDVRRTFSVSILERTLSAIMGLTPSLSSPQPHGSPLTRMEVDSLNFISGGADAKVLT